MKDLIKTALIEASCLTTTNNALAKFLVELRKRHVKLGFISGKVTHPDPSIKQANKERLVRYAKHIHESNGVLTFSSPQLFTPEHFVKVNGNNIDYEEWFSFWRDILKTETITDLFMSPGWEQSTGATDDTKQL